jgi:hypothetical protein
MGTVFINEREKKDLLVSEEYSLKLVRRIYLKIGEMRMHGLVKDQVEARDLKLDLDDELDELIGLFTNPDTHSPPKQKHTQPFTGSPSRKRGRVGGGNKTRGHRYHRR